MEAKKEREKEKESNIRLEEESLQEEYRDD